MVIRTILVAKQLLDCADVIAVLKRVGRDHDEVNVQCDPGGQITVAHRSRSSRTCFAAGGWFRAERKSLTDAWCAGTQGMGQVNWMGRALPAAALVVAFAAARPARAADCAVALVVNTDSPEFSRARVEQAIGDGLGAPIVGSDEPGARERC